MGKTTARILSQFGAELQQEKGNPPHRSSANGVIVLIVMYRGGKVGLEDVGGYPMVILDTRISHKE